MAALFADAYGARLSAATPTVAHSTGTQGALTALRRLGRAASGEPRQVRDQRAVVEDRDSLARLEPGASVLNRLGVVEFRRSHGGVDVDVAGPRAGRLGQERLVGRAQGRVGVDRPQRVVMVLPREFEFSRERIG